MDLDGIVRPETGRDHDAVRQVNNLAFGQDAEGLLVDRLRRGGFAPVSLVAQDNASGQVVGHILFSDLTIQTPTGAVAALALAPLAVTPEWQGRGIGTALVNAGLQQCRDLGYRIVVVLGHTHFYSRFGFSSVLAEALDCPFYSGPALMALEFQPGSLRDGRGQLQYAAPFLLL